MKDDKPKLSDQIRERLNRLNEETRDRPTTLRSTTWRTTIGHLIFDRATELVGQTSFALRQRPQLFPDVPDLLTFIDQIEEYQAQADASTDSRLTHLTLADMDQDDALAAQSAATGMIARFIYQVMFQANHRDLFPGLDHDARIRALQPAIWVLRGVRLRGGGKTPPRNALSAAADQPTPPTPAEVRAAKASRAARSAQVKERLARFLGRLIKLR